MRPACEEAFMKDKLSAKRITAWIYINYGIFMLGFLVLGSLGTDKYIVWVNFILDVALVAVSLVLNILLFQKKYQAPLARKIALLSVTLCLGAFTCFAFLMPENCFQAV